MSVSIPKKVDPLELSAADHRLLEAGICPLCHGFDMATGPRAGLSRDVLCLICGNEFCMGPVTCQHLGRASPGRVEDFYARKHLR